MMENGVKPEANFAELAAAILASCPLIDGHNDFPYMIRGWHQNIVNSRLQNLPIGQTDLSRLGKSGLGGQFWSAFVPAAKSDSEEARLSVLEQTLQQIDVVHQMVDAYPTRLGLAFNAADVWRQFHAGRLASLIGVEGLHQIAGRSSNIRLFHRLGVRYITLCHDRSNEYVDSATAPSPTHGGISSAGKDILLEMNRVGMIVDLSHTSHDVQRQALQLSRAPVIFSHSCAYALCESPRNVPDDALDMLKSNRGVCMVCFLQNLCTSPTVEEKTPSVSSVVDHIVYIGDRIGYEHVGIGSDFDGMLEGPSGLDDVRGYPGLVEEMLRRNMSSEEVKMVVGLNILRVLREVEESAFKLQNDATTTVLHDTISSPWTDEQKEMLKQQGQKRGLLAE